MSVYEGYYSPMLDLATIPKDRPVVLLLRHSDRPRIPVGQLGIDVALTPAGEERAYLLGVSLSGLIVSVHSSSVPRCRNTAKLMLEGAGQSLPIQENRQLGAPGCFIRDPSLAGALFLSLGPEKVYERQLKEADPVHGFYSVSEGVQSLLGVIPNTGQPQGIHLWITHDAILGILLSHVFEWDNESKWPAYLEGAWIWREADRWVIRAYGEGVVFEIR